MPESEIHIDVGGRVVSLLGAHPVYLDSLSQTDWRTHKLLIAAGTLPEDFTFFDVGANIGATAIAVAALFPKATVYAFEPVPSNVEHLRHNLAANGIENCMVIASGVGDIPSNIVINDNGPWSAVSVKGAGIEVPITTLDHFCDRFLIPRRLDLLKIDVEGYERRVLRGAVEILQELRPLIEVVPENWAGRQESVSPLKWHGAKGL